jgi:hypothetical protein
MQNIRLIHGIVWVLMLSLWLYIFADLYLI